MAATVYFADLIGHEKPREILSRMVQQNRLPHALLFSGPRGLGKHQAARLFAARDLCQNRQTNSDVFTPCGQCSSCQKFLQTNHADFITLEPENNRLKIESIRDLQKQMRLHTFYGGRRWIVIDALETATPQAQNALLRTLEEPSADSHFILLTSAYESLLPTIRSRCQPIRFGRLSDDNVTQVLKQAGHDILALKDLIDLAQGAPGKVFELLDSPDGEDLLAIRQNLLESLKKLVLIPPQTGKSPAQKGGSRDSETWMALELAAALAQNKNLRPWLLDLLSTFWRDLAVSRFALTPNSTQTRQTDLAELTPWASQVPLDWALKAFKRTQQLHQDFKINMNAQLTFENALLEFVEVKHGSL